MENSTPTLSFVVPLYQEQRNVRRLIIELEEVIKRLHISCEYILVDDGSLDDTWAAIKDVSNEIKSIHGIKLSRNFGKESALFAGLEHAIGNAVITLDGDLQHPPHLIPKMIKLWQENQADIVEGVKESRGQETFESKLRVKMFYEVFRRLSGYDLRGASDFKLMDRRVVDALLQMKEFNVFFRGMSAWTGFRRMTLPFTVAERATGESAWSVFRLFRLALVALTGFSAAPLHFVTLAGVAFLIFAIILGIQTLLYKLMGHAVSGFSTVILLLLIIGSLVMIALGIIGEYISRIYDEVKKRPRYIVSERIDS